MTRVVGFFRAGEKNENINGIRVKKERGMHAVCLSPPIKFLGLGLFQPFYAWRVRVW